jgi:hypothetical protein
MAVFVRIQAAIVADASRAVSGHGPCRPRGIFIAESCSAEHVTAGVADLRQTDRLKFILSLCEAFFLSAAAATGENAA